MMQQPHMGKFLKSITELQKKMDSVQKEIAGATFEGSAANGLVKVKMTGAGEIQSVVIDPSVVDSEDAETIGDLVVAASRVASNAKEAFAKSKLGTIASGALPFGMKIPGL